MRWTATGVWLIATLLAGCVGAPAPPPLRAQLPRAYPEAPTAQETLTTAGLDTWWTLYGDPQLDALEREALKGAPDADSALARLAAAKATLTTAVMAFNPQGALTAAGATAHTHLVDGNVDLSGIPASVGGQALKVPLVALGDTGSNDAAFNVSWELDLFGRRRATERVARADLAAARFQFEGARASLAAAVADSLFAARGLARETQAAEQALAQEQALVQLMEREVQAGLAPTSDLGRGRAALAKAQAQAVALKGQRDAQSRSLLVLVGRGTAPLSELPISTEAGAPPSLPATTPGDLLARRPDVREAEARLRSALGEVAIDRLELFPRFNLLPGVGIDQVRRPGNTYTTSLWSLGLAMAVPVLDRPRLLALARAQTARAAQAAADYEKSVQTAYGEASSVLGQISADERQIALLDSAQASARATLDAAKAGYQAGMSDARSAIRAEQAWSEAARELAQAQTQALRRSVQAFKALGGGWTPDSERVGRGRE